MEVTIEVPQGVERASLFGPAERNLKMIRESLGVNIAARDGEVHLRGEAPAVGAAQRVVERLIEAGRGRRPLARQDVLGMIAEEGTGSSRGAPAPAGARWREDLDVYVAGQRVEPKTPNQHVYLDAIRASDLVFAIGPAGTGKTYLAVAAAIHLLKTGRVKRVVLARPAVEAGERLGYLPGDQYAKVNPYLRPLLDALNDMVDFATLKRFMQSDVVEVAPLAFMRGRTLNDTVIILDEAQNTTRGQMQMLLTRMGQRSRVIVTGDTTQIDLPEPAESGLIDAVRRLRRVAGVSVVTLEREDVVRHELVQRVIEAYGETDPLSGREMLEDA